jgi:uncharacterized protein YdeI (YjbR/CyaY-like superfamily)
MKPVFFPTPASFRAWLSKHHGQRDDLWVGFYKRDLGKPSITWPESVDEALCFGWIDGIRKSLGDESYVIRFSPRTPRSTWSAVNIKRAKELVAQGRMSPAGLKPSQRAPTTAPPSTRTSNAGTRNSIPPTRNNSEPKRKPGTSFRHSPLATAG